MSKSFNVDEAEKKEVHCNGKTMIEALVSEEERYD